MSESLTTPRLPHGIQNAFLFSAFNALSFQVVLGSPMVLYAKGLGARATVLGIIAGMMPLLVVFQIPAANYINRIGYKRFVLGGWGTRVMFIFAIALVPLGDRMLGANNQLAVLLVLLFCFNLSRGISSCAWLPWITGLIPADVRGHYLARDQGMLNFASFITFLISALLLGDTPGPWRFAALFAFSAISGAISLIFLKRIPDVPVPEETVKSTTRVPWLAMLRHPPFWKLIRAVVAWSIAYGGMTAFTVAFLKGKADLPDDKILMITSVSFLGGLSSLWFLGARLDHLGSKPVMTFALAAWLAVMGGWLALAGGALATALLPVLTLEFLMGLLAALMTMATNRLAMAVIPVMGRNHFFALYSVLGSVTLGLAPIGWGVLIDAVGSRHPQWLGLDWNRYTVFFAAVAAAFGVTLALARRLQEPAAASMEALLKDLFAQSRRFFLLRFWPRS
ncbi:MAG TPA: MFS transporter [Verrucomicrobiae bacterium]|nr:MFS transporter [Verrucomicrobiae bacterium]